MKVDHVVNIAGVVLSAILGVIGTKVYDDYKNAVQYIDFRLNSKANILGKLTPQADFKVEGESVSDIGLIDFEIYNHTGKNLDDLTIDLLLKSKSGKSLMNKVKIIDHEFKDIDENQRLVTFRPIDYSDTEIKLTYLIKNCNQADRPVLTASMIVTNINDIDSHIYVTKTGFKERALEVKESIFSFSNPTANMITQLLSIVTILMLMFLVRRWRSASQSINDEYLAMLKKYRSMEAELERYKGREKPEKL